MNPYENPTPDDPLCRFSHSPLPGETSALPATRADERLIRGKETPPVRTHSSGDSAGTAERAAEKTAEKTADKTAEGIEPIPVTFPLPPGKGRWSDVRMHRMALLGILLVVGLLCLLPRLRACGTDGSFGVIPGGATETEDSTGREEMTETSRPPVESTGGGETSEMEIDTQIPPESQIPAPEETTGAPAPESGSASDPADTTGDTTGESTPETEAEQPPDTYPESLPVVLPPDTPDSGESETLPASSETEPETMPADAFPIVREDLSEPERSVGYIHCTADRLPPSIPAEGTRLWSTEAAPTVLIVHTHPYEGYHDGRDWYDPASGSLAQTDTPGDADGVVALGAAVTRRLRDAGVTVIHLRVPVAAGESAAATYARTEETVKYYCELYPDIGLVLDLRRSAELSEGGEILRTAGEYKGADCAQIRLSVSGDRPTEAVSRDIAVAVALRRALWVEEPSISRPVWVKSGNGIVGDLSRVAFLTVEIGSSGNSFAEAEVLVDPLGDAVTALVKK